MGRRERRRAMSSRDVASESFELAHDSIAMSVARAIAGRSKASDEPLPLRLSVRCLVERCWKLRANKRNKRRREEEKSEQAERQQHALSAPPSPCRPRSRITQSSRCECSARAWRAERLLSRAALRCVRGDREVEAVEREAREWGAYLGTANPHRPPGSLLPRAASPVPLPFRSPYDC